MPNRKIVVVKGSPRENGNSSTLADQVVAGAETAGAEVQAFYLHGMNIAYCDACEFCLASVESECVIDDDMHDIYPHLREADALVIASPVYWYTCSAQTKTFIDRCFALDGEGEKDGRTNAFPERVGIVMTFADSDPYTSGAVNAFHTFRNIADDLGVKIVGMVYGSAHEVGEIRHDRDVMEKAYNLGRQLGSTD